jgi:hypothetical protein
MNDRAALPGFCDTVSVMKKVRFLTALAISLSVSIVSAQDKRGPSTPAEREQALATIDSLEARPLDSTLIDQREWLLKWLIDVPDIHVQICLLLPDLPKGDKKDSNVIFVQMMLSGARYAIEHKDEPVNSIAQYQSGVRGAFRVYEALLRERPKDRQPALDELLKKRDDGTLDAYVQEQAASKCKR